MLCCPQDTDDSVRGSNKSCRYSRLTANFVNEDICKKLRKWLKHWHMGVHLRVLSERFPMNTNMAGFRGFSKPLRPCALDVSSLSIGGVNSIGGVKT